MEKSKNIQLTAIMTIIHIKLMKQETNEQGKGGGGGDEGKKDRRKKSTY